MQQEKGLKTIPSEDHIQEWFNKVAFELKIQRIKHDTNTLDDKVKQLYAELAVGEMKTYAEMSQKFSNDYYRKQLTLDFLQQLGETPGNLKRLAINYSLTSVLIWAEIEEGDEEAEDNLILLKASLNAKFNKLGYKISCTIVEDTDRLPIPSKYREIDIE